MTHNLANSPVSPRSPTPPVSPRSPTPFNLTMGHGLWATRLVKPPIRTTMARQLTVSLTDAILGGVGWYAAAMTQDLSVGMRTSSTSTGLRKLPPLFVPPPPPSPGESAGSVDPLLSALQDDFSTPASLDLGIPVATVGFGIIALAASLGTLRFALSSPPEPLCMLHTRIARASSNVGVPLLALSLALSLAPATTLQYVDGGAVPSLMAMLVSFDFLLGARLPVYTSLVPVLSILGVVAASLWPNPSGDPLHPYMAGAGALCFILSGLVGTKGEAIGGSVLAVNVFHLLLAWALALWTVVLVEAAGLHPPLGPVLYGLWEPSGNKAEL